MSGLALIATGIYVALAFKVRGNGEVIPELSSRVPDAPVNVLILGSDSRAVLPPDEQELADPTGRDRLSGQRADTIILLHLDEKREKAVIVHFPRDLLVTHPDGHQAKINGAYQQGPGNMVDTVELFTGIPIHHFIEVNFSSFQKLTEVVGGVQVYFENPIREPDSGLNVPAGCVTLQGRQALAFVRVRKIDSDFGRIERQQLFLRLLMERVTSSRVLFNPVKLFQLVDAVSENVLTDSELSLTDMRKMAFRLRNFSTSNVDMRIVPSAGRRINGISYVVHNEAEAEDLFKAIRERGSMPDFGRTGVSKLQPRDVRVAVLNGTAIEGLAAEEAEVLRDKGFEVQGVGNALRSDYSRTIVFYVAGNEDKARFVASVYGAEVQSFTNANFPESEAVLVLGKDRAVESPPPAAAPSAPTTPSRGVKSIHEC
jgi:LCP family protein required for cell wall assembly